MGLREETNKFDEKLRESCKEKIAEEKKLVDRIAEIAKQIDEKLHELKKICHDINEADLMLAEKKKEYGKVRGMIEEAQKKLSNFRESLKTENDNFERRDAALLSGESELLRQKTEINKTKERLRTQEDTARELLAKDRNALKLRETAHLDQVAAHEKSVAEFKISQEALAKERAEFEEEKKKNDAKALEAEQKHQETVALQESISKMAEQQARKSKEQADIDQKQGDRDLEQNLREAELNRKEIRVNNLIEVHRLK
jgi:hypothetical protein